MTQRLRQYNKTMIVSANHPYVTIDACRLWRDKCQDRKGRFLNDDSYAYGFGVIIPALVDFDVIGCHKHVNRYGRHLERGTAPCRAPIRPLDADTEIPFVRTNNVVTAEDK